MAYESRRNQPTISDKNYGKNCYLDNFVFLSPPPSQQCWGTMSESCVKQLCYGFRKLYRGREGILNALFKILSILSLIVWNLQKEKEEVRCMLFQITQKCFSGSDYAVLHSLMRIMTENGIKMTQKLPQ